MITECLSAAGITTIVWIDDFFASASREELVSAIQAHLRDFRASETNITSDPTFGAVDLTKSVAVVEDFADDLMESLTELELAEAERRLAAISGSSRLPGTPEPDLTPAEFRELQKALGEGLRTFSLAQWTSGGVTEFKSAAEDTLFLIDREFRREPSGLTGVDVLKDLVSRTTAFCVMLTHTCTEDSQEERRVEIAQSENLDAGSFSLLSKQQDRELGDMDSRFSRAIYAVMTHRFTGEIARTISDTIRTSAGITATELSKQSVFDLDQALFENSNREGVPEFDVVLRIFRVQERQAVNRALTDPKLQGRLQVARRFRRSTADLRKRWVPPKADMSAFREWRMHEVFEDGAGLNQMHAPLACGDVFESKTSPSRRYIFLAQPCDVMVREDGTRRNSLGLFVQVTEANPAEATTAALPSRYYDIKGVFGADRMWRIDFQKVTVVNAAVIELAVFNTDGSIALKRDHSNPAIVLPVGWQLRFERAKRRSFPKPDTVVLDPIGMGSNISILSGREDGDLVQYPLSRTGRLEPNTAMAILASWATFQTRAALEHDFAGTSPALARSDVPNAVAQETRADAH